LKRQGVLWRRGEGVTVANFKTQRAVAVLQRQQLTQPAFISYSAKASSFQEAKCVSVAFCLMNGLLDEEVFDDAIVRQVEEAEDGAGTSNSSKASPAEQEALVTATKEVGTWVQAAALIMPFHTNTFPPAIVTFVQLRIADVPAGCG
jgi:hypothetical protein